MEEYYDLTSNLDAREILRYLNSLGINNISGEVLKYFITDLKKLIKYDLENQRKVDEQNKKEEKLGPERLHSASTFSSRTRSKGQDGAPTKCIRECQIRKYGVRNVHSAPNLGVTKKTEEKPLRRACSCAKVERAPVVLKESKASSYNLIKVPKAKPVKKSDPVSLYHYYSQMWEKYKPNVPGENNWADLRWSVRQKMVGLVATDKVKEFGHHIKVKDK